MKKRGTPKGADRGSYGRRFYKRRCHFCGGEVITSSPHSFPVCPLSQCQALYTQLKTKRRVKEEKKSFRDIMNDKLGEFTKNKREIEKKER